MENCWVAVDKDGTEKASNGMMVRRFRASTFLHSWPVIRNCYSKNNTKKWANMWSTDDNDPMPFSGVVLPKGTIERLTGRKLTWYDEPIKI